MTDRSIVTYCWPGHREYVPEHVNRLATLCKIFAPGSRFVCVTDGLDNTRFSRDVSVIPTPAPAMAVANLQTPEGTSFPSSYRRLWTFSREARVLGELVLLLDVDCIPCAALEPLFDRPENFVGWKPRSEWGTAGRFGGGTWLHRTGTLTHIWDDFAARPQTAIAAARRAGYRGSDQAILSRMLRGAPHWPEPNGIYQGQDYPRITRPADPTARTRRLRRRSRHDFGDWEVPADARLLHFNGSIKPWDSEAPFVQRLYHSYFESPLSAAS